MKRMSKIVSLALIAVMVVTMLLSASGIEIFIIASSDSYAHYTTSAKYLETIRVMKGYEDGELHLEEPIQRYQAALFFGRLLTGVTNESVWGEGASAKYTDVPQYGEVIDMVSDMGIIRGYGNGKFGYNDGIRYQDMCAMLVRALGYETETMVASYPMSYVLKVEELGLALDGVKPADYLNRGQTAQMVYDTLTTPVANDTDEKTAELAKVLAALGGIDLTLNEEKETYLERNFDVSGTMYFFICATEKYKLAGVNYAEEGEFNAMLLTQGENGAWTYGDVWSFPMEGDADSETAEADLIGKYMTVVFDDKTPTPEELEEEACTVVHADVAEAEYFENLGELSYVKYEDEILYLGKNKVDFSKPTAPIVAVRSTDKSATLTAVAYADLTEKMDENGYFRMEAYDIDRDGTYELLIYSPYRFGQYVTRTYSDKTYTLIGEYVENAVYDVTSTAEKNEDNKTHFVEYLLPATARKTACGSITNYKPGDTSVRVGVSGELSNTVTVSGVSVQSGDFVLYTYDELTNKMYVGVNLGKMQVGQLSGIKTGAQTYTVDGAAMSIGMPGNLTANGLLRSESGFAQTKNLVRTILGNYEKGENNLRYIEYDGKLVYMEAYNSADTVVGGEYAILDVEGSFERYQDSLDKASDAWDLPVDGDFLLVDRYDPATDSFVSLKVENVTIRTGETFNFRNLEMRYGSGSVPEKYAYNLLLNGGCLYMLEDDNENGAYELYAYGTEDYNVLGAGVLPKEDAPEVYFTYGKSNVFIAENALGISTDRVETNADFVTVVIGQDGYHSVKGVIDGTTSAHADNDLYLSASAVVLDADDKMLVIFDPVGFLSLEAGANNLFAGRESSVWNVDTATAADRVYYMMVKGSTFVDSALYCDENDNPIKTDRDELLYVHTYKKLMNLATLKQEDVQILSTSAAAPAEDVVNSLCGVIYVDAEKYETGLTTFEEVYVDNGDYRVGSFARLADKDKISFTTEPKDVNGNGVIDYDLGEGPQSLYYNADEDLEYQTLEELSITYIDLDEGAGVNYREYSFADAYLFYNATESNERYYASVTLLDRPTEGEDYPEGTFPMKRFNYSGTEYSDKATNGRVVVMAKGDRGYYGDASFWRWNGWADYLIPAVDEKGNTLWYYEGSLRVRTTYYAFINYDEDAQSVDAVIVRVGNIIGVVGTDTSYEG